MLKIQETEVKNVIVKTRLPGGGFCANPYVGCTHKCEYCYATFMRKMTNHPEPWGDFLDVKYWPQIRNPEKYRNQNLFISSATDPYLPEEEQYQRTRTLLTELQGIDVKLSIQTKSDLVLRDIDLLQEFPHVRVGFSINTLDENFKNQMDCAVSIERRIAAMKKLHDSGILTTCFIAPIFPGITNIKAIINKVKDCCDFIWLENLDLKNDRKYPILSYIRENYPKLYPLYDAIYFRGNISHWLLVDQDIYGFAKRNGMKYLEHEETWIADKNPIITNFFHY